MTTVGKTITCKAAVVWEFNKPISIENVEVSVPQHGEVRIKMVAVGLCHSDLYILEGNVPTHPLPFIIGHEGAGIVESVGAGVTSVKPGDSVFTLCLRNCQNCKSCKSRRDPLCADLAKVSKIGMMGVTTGDDGKTRYTCKGKPVYHMLGCSSFSEYTVIPETACVKVNPKAPLDKACIMACGFSTGYGASTNSVEVLPGDTCIVWGMGGVGLATVVGCKDKGATTIIGVDVTTEKEAKARKLGCTDFVNLQDLKEPIVEVLKKMTNGGADFTFVCVGNAKAMEDAVLVLVPGGTMVVVGAAPRTEVMTISPAILVPSRKIVGSLVGDYKVRRDIPKLVDQYVDGKLPIDDFITHRFKLEQFNEAIEILKQGKSIRSVFTM